MKRWFPVNSCSKFRFLTESSRLLWICNTLLLTYNYSLLTCSKENVHLVLYSGFLCSFYKICCSWQQASLLVDECGVSSLCPEMAAQGLFHWAYFLRGCCQARDGLSRCITNLGAWHTHQLAHLFYFLILHRGIFQEAVFRLFKLSRKLVANQNRGWFGQLRLWSLSKGGTWSFTCWACMLNHVNTKIVLDVTTLC